MKKKNGRWTRRLEQGLDVARCCGAHTFVCGDTFTPTKCTAKYCENICRESGCRDNSSPQVATFIYKKFCVICGNVFETKGGAAKFCGSVCREKNNYDIGVKIRQRRKEKHLCSDCCMQCNKDFTRACYPGQEPKKFCGRSCALKYHNSTCVKQRTKPGPRKERFPVKCRICSKKMFVLKCSLDHHEKFGQVFTCGKLCRIEYTRSRHKGQKRSPESKAKREKTMLERYGVSHPFLLSKGCYRVSKGQRELFAFLEQAYPSYEFELEKQIFSKNVIGHMWFADVVSFKKNIVIEYYGDYWHCNPTTHKPTFFHKKKNKTAQKIWDDDKQRNLSLKEIGFDVIVFWESEVKKVVSSKRHEINVDFIKARLQERGYSV